MREGLIADVLVISDLHAMSPDVDVGRFVRFVEEHPARRLVLAGDTLDLYMWRHGRGRIDAAPGLVVLKFLLELVQSGVELVILPGNHDLEWAWLAGEAVPRRHRAVRYPDGFEELMVKLVGMPKVTVVNQQIEGDTVIVHGHEGWQGDWLWRMSETGDRLTRHKLVGGQLRRKVMGGAPNGLRAAAVARHGFYRRLAGWAKKLGMVHVIHGHTHVDGQRVRGTVVLNCLPAWRPSEGRGGGMILRGNTWEKVNAW